MSVHSGQSIKEVLQPKSFDLLKKNFQSIQNTHNKSRGRNFSQDIPHSNGKQNFMSNSLYQSNLPISVEPNVPPKTPPRGGLGWKMREVNQSINQQREMSQPKQFYDSEYKNGYFDHSTSQQGGINPYMQTAQGFYNQRTMKQERYRVESVDQYESSSKKRVPTEENRHAKQNYQSVELSKDEKQKVFRPRAQTAHSQNKRLINNPSIDLKMHNKKNHHYPQPEHHQKENRYHIKGKSTQFNNLQEDSISVVSGLSKYTSQSRLITSEQKQDNNQCFDIDYSFLDKISPNDPNIKKILNDDLLSNQSLNLEEILDQNPDYFHHMFGNCACFKCSCSECRCNFAYVKLNYQPGYITTNNKEFQFKQAGTAETPALNQTNYESLADLQRVQKAIDPVFTTTHQSFYKQHDLQPRFKRPKFYRAEHPFMGTTAYSNQFQNWEDYDPNWIFQHPLHVNAVGAEFPIGNNTSYGNFFNKSKQPIENANVDDVKKMQKNCVIDDLYRDEQPTMYKTTYQNFNIKDVPNTYLPFKWFSETEKPNMIPSFENQFRTTAQNDFQPQSQNSCPSKQMGMTKPWKAKLVNKLRVFREALIAAKLEGKVKQ